MALHDDATLVIGAGNFFKAPAETPVPADLTLVENPWDNLGHTSLEDIFGITAEGGEATTLGTLQAKQLRTRYSPRTDSLNFTIQQFDEDSLRLYFGANMAPIEEGSPFQGIPTAPAPYVGAFLAVFLDGENVFAFYAPKAEVYRREDMNLSDTESLAGLPLAVKPMVSQGRSWAFAVTPLVPVGTP